MLGSKMRSRVIAGGVAVATAVFGLGLVSPPTAVADTAPADTSLPETVSADPLPTVQHNGVAWRQVIVGNTVYVAGEFTAARPAGSPPGVNEVPRSNMLAFDIRTGQLVNSFAPSFNAQVQDVSVSPNGRYLYAAGNFTAVNGQTRYRVAQFDLTTGQLTSWRPSVNTVVYGVQATNDTVFIGGNFGVVQGATRTKFAALSAAPNAAVLPPSVSVPEGRVHDLAVSPDGSQVVLVGNFTSVNGSTNPGYGLARLNAVTGQLLSMPVNSVVRNAGTQSAVLNVETDGTYFYGSGYHFGRGGNVEGTFSADWATGSLHWIEDCHGDTYAAYPIGNVVYQASHKHYCGNSGGFPQTEPWTFYHSTATTADVRGTNTPDIYGYPDHPGRPRPEFLDWYPKWQAGTYTGKTQAVWAVTANNDYVVYGGEFPRVNNVAQNGLVRFARKGLAPNNVGPTDKGGNFEVAATSIASGAVRIAWPGNPDPDNATITYKLYRESTNSPPIYQKTVSASFWKMPPNSFVDSGLPQGSTQRYRVIAEDPFGNQALSDWVTVTVDGTGQLSDYALSVLNDSAVNYWRLGDSGSTLRNWAGPHHLTAGSGVSGGASGAIRGDTNPASRFSGSSSGTAGTTTAITGPQTFSIEAWFSTTSFRGGKIVGFGNRSSGDSSSYDRHVYMDSLGRLVFGVYPGSVQTIQSPSSYRDGRWHHVVASLSSAGMRLYVDGQLVASRANVTSAQGYTGYWRVGGDNLGSWPSALSSRFDGVIDEVAIYGSALSADLVARHHAIGTTGEAPNMRPTAAFDAPVTGRTVNVDASASSDSDGSVVSYAWDFGDGSTATGRTASRTYAAPGTYPVKLTVTDDEGATATLTKSVVIAANQAPTAAFTRTVNGLTVNVDASTSTDGDGTVASYAWDFGDGSTATGKTASRTYAAAGSYPVKLTVTDNEGATATVTHTVTVAPNQAPTASFTRAVQDLTVSVDASASSDADGSVASYAWNFGDGSSGNGVTASHAYDAAGTYTVTLTVTDNQGATGSVSHQVTVTEPAGPRRVAADEFGRTVASGWGTADQGGAWTSVGSASRFSVANGMGVHSLPTGATDESRLDSVSAHDVDLTVAITVDRVPVGGFLWSFAGARTEAGGPAAYASRVRFNPDGSMALHLLRGGTPFFGGDVAMTYSAGERWHVRLQVLGASPTTVRAKLWRQGQAEPAAWTFERTDGTAEFQGTGGGGILLRSFASSGVSNGPIQVRYDGLEVLELP